ncbi:MAG: biopolymer transporter ExbD [Bacteroidota bacterium]
MPLKRGSKVNAEFNMSSLTDIIFLLLIFFMLTSNFVQINPYELPESDSKTVAPTNITVQLRAQEQKVKVNNAEMSDRVVPRALADALGQVDNKEQATVTIVAEVGVPFSRVQAIIEAANRLKMRAIIATKPNS